MADPTIWTIRAALLGYFAACAWWLTGRPRRARLAWTLGALCYLAHVAAAFGFHYQWSHAVAAAETARQARALTGIDAGYGIWFNYAFTGIWIVDVAWMWFAPRNWESPPRWVTSAIHTFFLFMVINGAVVFVRGPIRWVSLAALTGLAILFLRRRSI
jgi:hypothetical protein